MADRRQRFFFPNTDLRGEILQLEQTLAPVLDARDYPLVVSHLLGESLAAIALMAGTLKFAGRLSLQAQGSGPVSLLLAEASHDNTVRGVARWKHDSLLSNTSTTDMPNLGELLGSDAKLVITLRPEHGQNYQSLVPLEGSSLAPCLGAYFEQSEQLPTALWLACGNGKAAGLLLQRLPTQNGSEDDNQAGWQSLKLLADTLTSEELLSLPAEALLHRLFHETPPELAPAEPLSFACTCERQRVTNMLISLGETTLQTLLDEDGQASVTCEFCQQTQAFDRVDLAGLIHQAKTRSGNESS